MIAIDLRYPVRYCHFCGQMMFYNRYENGEHYAYCNNPTYSSCMGFTYRVTDDQIKVKEFTLAHTDILYFRARNNSNDQVESCLLVANPEGDPHAVSNFMAVDMQTILHKEHSCKLLEKIRKAVLLLD